MELDNQSKTVALKHMTSGVPARIVSPVAALCTSSARLINLRWAKHRPEFSSC